MADEYGPTFITVTDEDGREISWSWLNVQNASMKAEARRALVIRGMLWSMAPRRIQ